jgi:poly-gamma-glutamate synthase PgsB/CapB
MPYVILLLIIALLYFVCGTLLTVRARKRIRYRIHVNGTRGKSIVTRYITIALAQAGIKTYGKVTGEIPTLIGPGGEESRVHRNGTARVTEQFRIIRQVARRKAEALVLECMSVDPELQKVETAMFNPDIYVITNIKDDHREKLGTTPAERATLFARTVPPGSTLVMMETKHLEVFRNAVHRGGGNLVTPPEPPVEVTQQLPFGTFAENISIAAEVAFRIAGIPREDAITLIKRTLNPVVSLPLHPSGQGTRLLNGFSVNDPESATDFLDAWRSKHKSNGKIGVILNTRADRPTRTRTFVSWIRKLGNQCSIVVVTGDHRHYARRKLKYEGADTPFELISEKDPRRIITILRESYRDLELVFGTGNMKGNGFRILEQVKALE